MNQLAQEHDDLAKVIKARAEVAISALGGVDTYRIHKTIAARVTTAW